MSFTYLANDGSELHYEVSGSGPPIIMVHGFASSGQVFEKQLASLEPCFTVYRPDLRGHGRSREVTTGARTARLGQDLKDLITTEKLDDVRLVGWSMGCTAIWSYLDIYGEKNVHSYVFLDEIPYVLESVDTVGQTVSKIDGSSLLGLHQRFANPETRTEQVVSFIESMLRICEPGDRAKILGTAEQAASELSVGLLLDSIATDYRDLIPRLSRPALFLCGDSSFFDVEFSIWMDKVAQNSALQIVFDAGHFLTVEHPELVSKQLLAFFQKY